MNELTIEQALEIIGNSLANENLKMSQREHSLNVQSYLLIKEKLLGEPVKEVKESEIIKP